MIRYAITHRYPNGLRGLTYAAQARFMYETRVQATNVLLALLEGHNADRLDMIHGPQSRGTFRVDAFDCYETGDPRGIYVDEV